MADTVFSSAEWTERENFQNREQEYRQWKKRSNLYYHLLMLPLWLAGVVGIGGGSAFIIAIMLHFVGVI